MNKLRIAIALAFSLIVLGACTDQGERQGSSTPIDSTNMNGTAPATYGGDDPANLQDTNRTNVGDIGTNAANAANTPDDQN
jgi:hypothetical protein